MNKDLNKQYMVFFNELCDTIFIKNHALFFDKLGRAFFLHFNHHINIFEISNSQLVLCRFASDPRYTIGNKYELKQFERSSSKVALLKIIDQYLAVIEMEAGKQIEPIIQRMLALILSLRNYNNKDILVTYKVYKQFQTYTHDIVLLSNEIKMTSKNKNTTTLVKKMQSNITNLVSLMNDHFDYKLIEHKKLDMQINLTNGTVVKAMLKDIFKDENQDIDLNVFTDTNVNFNVDEKRLIQIIINTNASISKNDSSRNIGITLMIDEKQSQLNIVYDNVANLKQLEDITVNHDYLVFFINDQGSDNISFLLSFFIATKLVNLMNGGISYVKESNRMIINIPVTIEKEDIISNTKIMIFNFQGSKEEKNYLRKFFVVRNAFFKFTEPDEVPTLFDVLGEWSNTSVVFIHYSTNTSLSTTELNKAISILQKSPELKQVKYVCLKDINDDNVLPLNHQYDYIINSVKELETIFSHH